MVNANFYGRFEAFHILDKGIHTCLNFSLLKEDGDFRFGIVVSQIFDKGPRFLPIKFFTLTMLKK